MFYALSKIAYFLVQPSSMAVLLVAAGLLLQRRRREKAGTRLAISGLVLLVVLGLSPLGNALVLPLEQRFAEAREPVAEDRVSGIVILGGFEDGWVSAGRGGLGLNEAAERLTESIRLARRLPDAKVIFTGGAGSVLFSTADAAGAVGEFLAAVGIPRERIVLEAKSRNTHENAVFTADIVKPQPGQRWVLVTSAYHMPRSVGIFRKAGFDELPWPVDYRTQGWGDAARPFDSIPDGFKRLDLAAKEWIGLVAYYVTGRSSELWPGPLPRDRKP